MGTDEALPALRRRLYLELDPGARPGGGLSGVNLALIVLILGATALAVAETEPLVAGLFGPAFEVAEMGLGTLFLLEYAARLWVAPEGRPDLAPWRARLRFILSLSAVIDLIAVVGSLGLAFGSDAVLLRVVRLFRILRLAKLGRMSRAFEHMAEAVSSRREELMLSLAAGIFLMFVSATLLHLAEGQAQPDKFGSIPRALWWAVATLKTIGYGDVYPVTLLGKVLAALTALFSIGLIAMPTGILAAAFSDAMQRHRQTRGEGDCD